MHLPAPLEVGKVIFFYYLDRFSRNLAETDFLGSKIAESNFIQFFQ